MAERGRAINASGYRSAIPPLTHADDIEHPEVGSDFGRFYLETAEERKRASAFPTEVKGLVPREIRGGCERRKGRAAKPRRKLVLDDHASERERERARALAPFRSSGSSRGSFIVGRQAFNFTSGHATYILYLLLLHPRPFGHLRLSRSPGHPLLPCRWTLF